MSSNSSLPIVAAASALALAGAAAAFTLTKKNKDTPLAHHVLPSNPSVEKFKEVAEAYGPAMTKAVLENNLEPLKALFVDDEPITVTLQTAEGHELAFSVGDTETFIDPDIMSWEEFQQVAAQEFKTQDFKATVSECCGVLGDRMILETARLNSKDEMYCDAFFIVSLDGLTGKIWMMEAFSDLQSTQLLNKATATTH